MYNELTKIDIQKMNQEIEYRKCTLRPELLKEVKRTRAFGDLSENFEYKEAKRAQNRNESRIRYLTNMINTAKIIEDNSAIDTVGIYDKVECFIPDLEMTMTVQIVTTVRNDVDNGFISKESPFGKAIFGKKAGDEVIVDSPDGAYSVKIISVTKAEDDGSLPLISY